MLNPTPTNSSQSQSSSSPLPSEAIATIIIWLSVIAIFSLAITISIVTLCKSRSRRSRDAESGLAPQTTPKFPSRESRTRPISGTSTLSDDWQEWIARQPPPLRGDLRRSGSAVLFGTMAGECDDMQHLLTAHEVEVSGVLAGLDADIPDPPPAYSPRRL